MIISPAYAKRLIKTGKATIVTRCYNSATDEAYWVINRHDLQRTDHVAIAARECAARGYIGFTLHMGETFTRASMVHPLEFI